MITSLIAICALLSSAQGATRVLPATREDETEYRRAVMGLQFKEAPVGAYFEAYRGKARLEYPTSAPQRTATVTLSVGLGTPPKLLDYARVTVIDVSRRFLFRMGVPHFEASDLVICDPQQGSYLLHVSCEGYGEKLFRFRIDSNQEKLDLGVLWLKK